ESGIDSSSKPSSTPCGMQAASIFLPVTFSICKARFGIVPTTLSAFTYPNRSKKERNITRGFLGLIPPEATKTIGQISRTSNISLHLYFRRNNKPLRIVKRDRLDTTTTSGISIFFFGVKKSRHSKSNQLNILPKDLALLYFKVLSQYTSTPSTSSTICLPLKE